jgi:hypothetical protein
MSVELTEFLKGEQYKELEGKHRLTHPNHQENALQLGKQQLCPATT